MVLDASERGPDGRGRRRDEERSCAAAAGAAQVKRAGFYSAPTPMLKSEVVSMSGIRSAGPAVLRDVAPPWPRQLLWREALRNLKKTA